MTSSLASTNCSTPVTCTYGRKCTPICNDATEGIGEGVGICNPQHEHSQNIPAHYWKSEEPLQTIQSKQGVSFPPDTEEVPVSQCLAPQGVGLVPSPFRIAYFFYILVL